MHHPRSIGTALDTLDPYSWQPKQQCRTVGHSPWFLPSPECFATLRLQKAKGLLLQRHAHESEITTARLNFKSRCQGAQRVDADRAGVSGHPPIRRDRQHIAQTMAANADP